MEKERALVKTRIAENPDDPFANCLLSQITHAFGEDASLNPLAAATQPPSYKARVELAKFYLAPDHPNPSGAENAANKVLKLDRTRVEPWITLATLYTERGEWNALDGTFTDGGLEVPDDLAPYYYAATALLRTGRDLARAERYLRFYLEHEPEGNEPTLAGARRKLNPKTR